MLFKKIELWKLNVSKQSLVCALGEERSVLEMTVMFQENYLFEVALCS